MAVKGQARGRNRKQSENPPRRHYRFVRVRNRRVVTNDADPGNSRGLILDCFGTCEKRIIRRLHNWFRDQKPHFIQFEFGQETIIITNRVNGRSQ